MSNTPSPVDNTTGAHDEIPAPGGAGNTVTTKTPWYLSYVLWTNLAALASMLLPSVRDWLANNPIEFTTALTAVNTLLGFISRGTIQLTGQDGQSGQSANLAGALPPSPVTGEGSTSPVEDRSQDPDQDPSSIPPSSGSSSPLSGTSRLMVVLGALMLLLGGRRPCGRQRQPERRAGDSHPWKHLSGSGPHGVQAALVTGRPGGSCGSGSTSHLQVSNS